MKLLISTEKNSHFSVMLDGKVKTVEKPYKQAEFLLKEIDKMKAKSELHGIIVVQGPGEFSALRIGIATANALAKSWQVPLVGIKLKKSWLVLSEQDKLEKVWQAGVNRLDKGENDRQVMPFYDKEPNIT
jgi:hypothetical protein